MKKTQKDNSFLWSGVAGGLSSLLIYFVGGSLPVAVASGAALFAAGSVLFKKPKQPPEPVVQPMDEATLLEKGCEGVKSMHELSSALRDDKVRKNADEVAQLCDIIIGMVSEDAKKLKKSTKLFTYYIPTINKTLGIYRKLEASDTAGEVYEQTNRFLDDCEAGLKKHIQNLSGSDLSNLSVEMEVMTTVMNIDGLVSNMDQNITLPEKK